MDENRDVPVNWRVEKMRLTPRRDAVMVNEWLTLAGISARCFNYRLGNRSALEWVIVEIKKFMRVLLRPGHDDEF